MLNKYWACNGERIGLISAAAVSQSAKFRTYSVYHCQDTFYVVDYDAVRYPVGEINPPQDAAPNSDHDPHYVGWQRMSFQHTGGSSFASLAGNADRLERSEPACPWTVRLLPPAYHGPRPKYGESTGMNGHLPLLLALILLAYGREMSERVLENLFQNGVWGFHDQAPQWEDKRGIVVDVWAWPGLTDANRLKAFERGDHGTIFR